MQISRLFKDTPDLCSEFRVLMPDTLKHKRKSEENKESEEGRETESNEISGPSKVSVNLALALNGLGY